MLALAAYIVIVGQLAGAGACISLLILQISTICAFMLYLQPQQ
jgi:hypothetical protein